MRNHVHANKDDEIKTTTFPLTLNEYFSFNFDFVHYFIIIPNTMSNVFVLKHVVHLCFPEHTTQTLEFTTLKRQNPAIQYIGQ